LADHRAFRLHPSTDLTAALCQAKASGCNVNLGHSIFFNARDAVMAKPTHNFVVRAQLILLDLCCATRASRGSVRSTGRQFIEVGRLVEI
jgi:hypothetical protein